MGKIAKDNLIYMVLGVLIGALGFFLINQLIDKSASESYKQWRETEEFKRDSIRIAINASRKENERMQRQIDSITFVSDSIHTSQLYRYSILQTTLKKIKDETLNYLHTVDSAYLVILSRE